MREIKSRVWDTMKGRMVEVCGIDCSYIGNIDENPDLISA